MRSSSWHPQGRSELQESVTLSVRQCLMTEGKTLVEGGRRAKPKQLPAGPREKRPLGRLFSSNTYLNTFFQKSINSIIKQNKEFSAYVSNSILHSAICRSKLCTGSFLESSQDSSTGISFSETSRGPCKSDWGSTLMVKENGRLVIKHKLKIIHLT